MGSPEDDPASINVRNVRFWDALASVHGHGDTYYDLEALEGQPLPVLYTLVATSPGARGTGWW